MVWGFSYFPFFFPSISLMSHVHKLPPNVLSKPNTDLIFPETLPPSEPPNPLRSELEGASEDREPPAQPPAGPLPSLCPQLKDETADPAAPIQHQPTQKGHRLTQDEPGFTLGQGLSGGLNRLPRSSRKG